MEWWRIFNKNDHLTSYKKKKKQVSAQKKVELSDYKVTDQRSD